MDCRIYGESLVQTPPRWAQHLMKSRDPYDPNFCIPKWPPLFVVSQASNSINGRMNCDKRKKAPYACDIPYSRMDYLDFPYTVETKIVQVSPDEAAD